MNVAATPHLAQTRASNGSPHGLSAWARLRRALPAGRALPAHVWDARHRFILFFVFAHAIGLAMFGLLRGWGPWFSLGEGALIAALGGIAAIPRFNRPFRSTVAALAAVTSSAVFTQFMGGYIEGHFHYFVVVALIAMYQDWVPFLLAIGFVAVDHGIMGSLVPTWVYNHPEALAHPWRWALIHATLVLGECAVLVALWKATEEARARTDLVLDSAAEGIMGLDPAGRVTFANPAAATMLGQPLAAVVGQAFEKVLAAASEKNTELDMASVRVGADGARNGRGTAWLSRNGQQHPLDWTLSAVTEHGLVVGSVLTLTDASERVRAEAEHSQRIQQYSEIERLKQLDQFKSLFINTAAHELHTPLTPLRLNIFALKEGHRGALSADQLDTIHVLDRNVERLSHLVEDVLSVARLQGNRLAIAKNDLDLAAVARESAHSFREPANAAGVRLTTLLAGPLRVGGDARRLAQVVDNLVENAIKFSKPGGLVTIETAREHGAAVLRVRDDGVGLRPEDLGKLFQPFSQAHSHMERTRAGSGLGLYICKGLVELHGGRIEVRSDGVGRGAVFQVTLPLSDPTALRVATPQIVPAP